MERRSQRRCGPQELTGAVDMLTHYGLRDHYEAFCKKPLPLTMGASKYLRNVVSDLDIQRGEGMELGQFLALENGVTSVDIHQFDTNVLHEAFSLRESGSISIPEADRGIPTMTRKVNENCEGKGQRHSRHKKHKISYKSRKRNKKWPENVDKDRGKDKGEDLRKERHGADKPKLFASQCDVDTRRALHLVAQNQ